MADIYDNELPIKQYEKSLIQAIQDHSFLIVIGETGSGKTTQLPQYLLDDLKAEGNRPVRICVTQPRRIAAVTVAKRVCEERNSRLGDEVGYVIRFDDNTSPKTRLRYVTDGILVREACFDPSLSAYDVIVIDEAHERSLETDLLLGLIKNIQKKRKDLRVVIMSATLNVDKFSMYFNECPIFTIPGRLYDVDVVHHSSRTISQLKYSHVEKAVDTAIYIHLHEEPGDILVFLTGRSDIEMAIKLFEKEMDRIEMEDPRALPDLEPRVYPIYAALDTLEQKEIFRVIPKRFRKIVFATNIAQTSITIPNIKYVVDSGFVKEKSFESKTNMDALLVVPISKSAAEQRAGRAGRTEHGKCYRLYNLDSFEEMIDDTIPEIQRSSLMGSVLTMKVLGIDSVLEFEFIDQPDRQQLIQALRRLYLLGALDENGKLTSVGQALHKIPISPYLAKSLYESISNFDCFEPMLTLCSMLSAEDIWLNIRNTETKLKAEKIWRSQFYHSSGDHATLINVYQQFERNRFSKSWCSDHYLNYRSLSNANNIRGQLKGIVQNFSTLDKSKLKESKSDEIPVKSILQCLSTSYFLNVAKRHPSKSHFYHYGTTSSALVPSDSSHMQSELLALYIHPTSSLAYKLDPSRSHHSNIEWVIYHEMVYTSQAMIKTVSKVLFEWPKPYIDRLLTMDDNKLSGIEVKRKPELIEPEIAPEADTIKTPEVEENNEELLAQNRLTKAEEAKLRFLQRKKMKRK